MFHNNSKYGKAIQYKRLTLDSSVGWLCSRGVSGRSVKIKLTEIALKRPQNGPKTTETSWNISTQKMESYPKSAIAEDDLQNAYYNIQEREIVWTHACQSKLSKTIK